MTIRVAVVGAGGIGRLHANAYRADGRAEVVAVCEPDPERARAFARDYGCPAFAGVAEMIASGTRVDTASVATAGLDNGSDHHAPTIALLAADIAVLGEKPISNDLAEATEMVALARQREIPYGINLNHHFTPAARRAKEWIDAGRLGEVNMARITLWLGNPNESSPYFHLRALHPHSVDVLRYLCGDIERVHALLKRGPGRINWSNALLNLEFRSGVIGVLTGSYDAGPAYGLERCEVIGSKAMLTIQNAFELLTLTNRSGGVVERHENLGGMTAFDQTFQARVTAWIDDLVKRTRPEDIDGSGEDGLRAQQVIEAAIESWEQQTVVQVGTPVSTGHS
ncbi:MAG: Gfo/Idh/MocA family protein [Candidatus Dormibacteria bacterium]